MIIKKKGNKTIITCNSIDMEFLFHVFLAVKLAKDISGDVINDVKDWCKINDFVSLSKHNKLDNVEI